MIVGLGLDAAGGILMGAQLMEQVEALSKLPPGERSAQLLMLIGQQMLQGGVMLGGSLAERGHQQAAEHGAARPARRAARASDRAQRYWVRLEDGRRRHGGTGSPLLEGHRTSRARRGIPPRNRATSLSGRRVMRRWRGAKRSRRPQHPRSKASRNARRLPRNPTPRQPRRRRRRTSAETAGRGGGRPCEDRRRRSRRASHGRPRRRAHRTNRGRRRDRRLLWRRPRGPRAREETSKEAGPAGP